MYSPREYWERLARGYAQSDVEAFAPILHPGTPPWYNVSIDHLQQRAWSRALASCALPPGARVLDVGCGTGRWLRRLAARRLDAFGADRTAGMLRLAAGRGSARLVCAEGQRLPFPTGAFDAVTSVTVLQHIPASDQGPAMDELARVTRPGGYLVLFELIRGRASHVFPHPPERWLEQFAMRRLNLVSWFGQEFLLLDRLFTATVRLARSAAGVNAPETLPDHAVEAQAARAPFSLPKRLFWGMRRLTVGTSFFLEPLAEKVCPGHWATHGVFILRK